MGTRWLAAALLLCAVLAEGCVFGPGSPIPRPEKLSLMDEPDAEVSPPAWYKPPKKYEPWPLPDEPEHGTEAWRHWCAVAGNSRDVVRWVATPPTIDGKLDDPVWKSLAFKTAFADEVGKHASPGTTVYAGYDIQNLYLGLRVHEPYPNQLHAQKRRPDGAIRADDHVEINLAPKWQDKAFGVYWFLVNPKGSVADGLDSDLGWSADVKAAASVQEKEWTVELSIPLKDLGAKPGDLWGAVWACRLLRFRLAGGERAASSWTRLLSARAAACNWGHVIFKGVKPPEKKPKLPPKTGGPTDKKKPPEPKRGTGPAATP